MSIRPRVAVALLAVAALGCSPDATTPREARPRQAIAATLGDDCDLGVGARSDPAWVTQYGGPGDEDVFDIEPSPVGVWLGMESASSWFGTFVDPCVNTGASAGRDCGDAVLLNSTSGEGIQFGGPATDEVRGVRYSDGVVALGGRTMDDSDGSPANDSYVRAVTADLAGEVFWTPIAQPKDDEILSLALVDGQIFTAGGTYDSWRPDGSKSGDEDGLVFNLAMDGKVSFVQQIGTEDWEEMMHVAADEDGVYVVGHTEGWFDDEPGQSFGDHDAVLFSWPYDLSVDHETCRTQLGTEGRDIALSVAARGDSIYLGGSTDGILNAADPDGSRCHHDSDEVRSDAFVARYDKHCNPIWTREFGGFLGDEVAAVAVDDDFVYVAGYTGANKDHLEVPNLPTTDAFLRLYTLDGDLSGEVLFDSSVGDDLLIDYARAVRVEGDIVYVAGSTEGALGLGPSFGARDGFLAAIPIDAVAGNAR